MDRLDDMRAFVAVADARSFTRGAARLGVSPAQVSKAVARLEDRLGARLLHRTTRDVSLTDVGQAYLERARELSDSFQALEASVQDTGTPRGLLKLSAPTVFGATQLAPALLDFAAAYPELGLEVSFANRFVNLVEEGFDAAVRISRLADSSLTGRKIAETRAMTLASPAWLEQHGTPASPTELAMRDCILDLNTAEPTLWSYGGGAFRFDVRVSGRLRFSDLTLCLAAARAGLGVARAPAFAAAEDLRAGRLKAILVEHEPDPIGVHVLYPHPRHLAAKVRALVDFLARRFNGDPEWHQGWS
jgi:DNA-binding transcriptional LysR family regulator